MKKDHFETIEELQETYEEAFTQLEMNMKLLNRVVGRIDKSMPMKEEHFQKL